MWKGMEGAEGESLEVGMSGEWKEVVRRRLRCV